MSKEYPSGVSINAVGTAFESDSDLLVGDIGSHAVRLSSTEDGYLFRAGTDITVGKIARDAFDIDVAGTLYGLYAGRNISFTDAYFLNLESQGGIVAITADKFDASQFDDNHVSLHAGANGNVVGVSANEITLQNYSGKLTLETQGNGDITAFRAPKMTINGFSGTVSIQTGKDGYGIHSETATSLNVTNSTGTIEIVAEGDAYGIRQSQFLGEGPSYNKEINIAFDNYDMKFDVKSTHSSAYGISVSTQSFGQTKHTHREDGFTVEYYTYGTAVSDLAMENLRGHLTVQADKEAYGIHVFANGSASSNESYHYSSNVDHHTKTRVTIADIEGRITVSGKNFASGIYTSSSVRDTILSVANITGNITATSDAGSANALYSDQTLKITGDVSGNISVNAGTTANAFVAGGTLSIGKISGKVEVNTAGGAAAFSSGGAMTIGEISSQNITVTSTGSGNVYAFKSNTSVSIQKLHGTQIKLESQQVKGDITAISAPTINISNFSGSLELDAPENEGNVAAFDAENTVIDAFTGAVSVRAGNNGYGINSESASSLAVTNSTGSFEIEAEGDAYGIRQSQFIDANKDSYNKVISLTFNNQDMGFDVTSKHSSAYGISVSTESYGHTRHYYHYGPFLEYYDTYGTAVSNLTMNNLRGHITVLADKEAYGVYALAAGFASSDETSGPSSSAVDHYTKTMLSIADIEGEISVTGGSYASGIYASSLNENKEKALPAELSVANISGDIAVKATGGSANALYSAQTLKITGDVSGNVSITAKTTANAVLAGGELSIGTVSGKIEVNTAGGAVAFSSGGAMTIGEISSQNITVTSNGLESVSAFKSDSSVSIQKIQGAQICLTSAQGDVAVISAPTVNLSNYDGKTAVNYSGNGEASWIDGTNNVTLTDVKGAVEIISNGTGYGVKLQDGGTLSVQNLSGSISIIASEDAYGLYSSSSLTVEGSLTNDFVVSSTFGNAALLHGGTVTLNGGTVAGSAQIQAMEISGNVIVDGAQSATALVGNRGMSLDVSGIVAAGSFQKISGVDDVAGFVQELRSLNPAQQSSQKIIQNATGTAIADGTMSGATLVSASNDDVIEIQDGAVVLGDVALGGGTNQLTIHSGGGVYGDITGSNLQLTFDLSKRSNSAIVTASSTGDFFAAGTTITVNIDNNTQKGRYVLASFGGSEDFSAYQDHAVKIMVNGTEYRVVLNDDFDATGFADVNLTQDGELELIYGDIEDFFVVSDSIQNSYLSAAQNGSLTLTFSRNIDAGTFRSSMVQLSDKSGRSVEIRNTVVNGKQLTISFDPLSDNVNYQFTLSSQIKSVDGKKLDQNLDGTPGTAEDDYKATFNVDTVAPKITKITPQSPISGTFSKFQVVFSEAVVPSKVLSAIKISNPSGQKITPTGYRQLSETTYEILIPNQTKYGSYQIEINDSISDAAGNKLANRQTASVTLMEAEAPVVWDNGAISPSSVELGEGFTASWNIRNDNGTIVSGEWTDGVYISNDAVWDINDTLLGTVVHSGGIGAWQTISSEKTVSITNVVEGDYYVLVRGDIDMQISGRDGNGKSVQNVQAIPVSVSVQTLTANQTVRALSAGNGSMQFYRFRAESGRAYNISLDSLANSANMEIYVGYGYVPTREKYDNKVQKLTDGSLFLAASDISQDLYIMTYNRGHETNLQYDLCVENVSPISIAGMSGMKQSNKHGSMFDISGTGFDSSISVTLEDANGNVYRPADTNLISDTRMQVTFAAGALSKGYYTIHLNSAQEGEYVYSEKVQIVRDFGGTAAVSAVTPKVVSNRDYQNIKVTVQNTGYEYIDAPLVVVSPTLAGRSGALLSMNGSRSSSSFWTSTTPDGYSNSASFLAQRSCAGALAPGEKVSIPVSYLGWNGSETREAINWGVSYIYSDNKTEIDWKKVFSVSDFNQELKDLLSSRFQGEMSTLGNYVSALNRNLSYLSSIGENTSVLSGEDLLQFELKRHIGWLSPYRVLLTSTDVSSDTTGSLGFSVSREYYTDLHSREKQGSFGYGWVTSLDSYLEISENGDLTFHEGNFWRRYQPNFSKGYQTVAEDGSVMKAVSGGYKLTEQDGSVSQFNDKGLLTKKTDANGNYISYFYNGNGKLVRMEHSCGVSYFFTRDGDGRIIQIFGNDGQDYTYSYDSDGNLISAKNAVSGEVDSFAYGDFHGLTRFTAADGTKSSFTYDKATHLLTNISTRGGNNTTSISYGTDAFVTVSDDQGHSYQYYYGADERIQKIADNTTGEIYFADYDSQRRLTFLKDSKGQAISLSYDSKGNLTGLKDSMSNTASLAYDSKGNVTSIRDVYGNVSTISYDAHNNPVSIRYADGTTETFKYDGEGNLISATDVKGVKYSYTYDSQGHVISVSGNNAQTSYSYDKAGNVTSVTYADGTRSTYGYNGGNDLTLFKDAKGNSIRYDYTAGGSLSKITYADGSSESYSYNSVNELSYWTNRRGGSVSYLRDSHGNVIQIAHSDGTFFSCTYDSQSRLATAGDLRFTYDNSDNVTAITSTDGRRISYTFDADDRVISVNDGKNTTNYSYTVQGDLDKLTTASGALIVDYDYDSFGRLSKVTNGNGTRTIYTYTRYGEVSAIDHYDKNGNVTGFEHYTYNSDNRCTVKETQDGRWSYTYDKVGQLTSAVLTKNGTTLRSEAYTYDSVGNRTKSVIDGVTTAYTYNSMNQIVSANGFAYRYDKDGNLLEDEKRIYTWTTDNRVASEKDKSTGQVWTYGYDALGNRTSVTTNGVTTTYTVDANGNVLAEYVNGVFSRSYIQGNQLAAFTDASGNMYYYNADMLGSTTGITNSSGITVNSYSYDSFGNVLSSTEGVANDFEFVGGYGLMSNASGTTFVRARNYDAETGRWISADPIGIEGGENLYVYCGNDGVNYVDMSGHEGDPFFAEFWKDFLSGKATGGTNNLHDDYYKVKTTNTAESLGSKTVAKGTVQTGSKMVPRSTFGSLGKGNLFAKSSATAIVVPILLDYYNTQYYEKGLITQSDYERNQIVVSFSQLVSLFPQAGAFFGGAVMLGLLGQAAINWMSDLEFSIPDNAGTPVPTDSAVFQLALDPNDMRVAEGYGDKLYVAAGSELNYTVMFENDPEWATAPARWVRVYDTLSDKYDLDTFELKSFTVAGNYIEVGDGRDSYNQQDWITVDGEDVLLRSAISLVTDEDSGETQLVCEFMAIDPETGTLLSDITKGLLQPNDETGRGEGEVEYSISVKSDLANGSTVENSAEIYFDFNEPIDTPTTVNTIDSENPVVDGFSYEIDLSNSSVTFTLSGSDAGSGLYGYNLAYSDDGTDYIYFATTTESTYTVTGDVEGELYFRAQAIDNVGNVSEWVDPISVDTAKPTLDAFSLELDPDNSDRIILTMSGSDAGSGIYGYQIGYSKADSNFTYEFTTDDTYTFESAQKDEYYFYARAIDNARNVSEWSGARNSNDDWNDLKTAGAAGHVGTFRFDSDTYKGAHYTDKVGTDDPADYRAFTLDYAASLRFTAFSDKAVKFTIYSLQSKTNQQGVTTYSLKKLQRKSLRGGKTISTKSLLLEAGTYYIGVDNAKKKNATANYSVTVDPSTVFFTKGDNSDDVPKVSASARTVRTPGELLNGWVGFGDAVDYAAFTLDSAANLAFDLNVTGNARFTIYSLSPGDSGKTGTLKRLQRTTIRNGESTTKNLLLQKGTYYLAVESTKAKRGGSVDYTVSVSDKTAFFTKGDNSDDWTDMKTAGAASLGAPIEVGAGAGDLLNGWVGYGDAVDYAAFTLESAADLAFDLSVTDAAKFSVYSLQGKAGANGATAYSLKKLQRTTLKKGDSTTKSLHLEAGTYYLAMESTKAKKGGSVDYSVAVAASSTFFNDEWSANKNGFLA